MRPTSPEGSNRPTLPLRGRSGGGGGGESFPGDGATLAAAAAPSVAPRLVSELRDDANRKVRAGFCSTAWPFVELRRPPPVEKMPPRADYPEGEITMSNAVAKNGHDRLSFVCLVFFNPGRG